MTLRRKQRSGEERKQPWPTQTPPSRLNNNNNNNNNNNSQNQMSFAANTFPACHNPTIGMAMLHA
jgi:hypothetical protein